ncbi:MAG TPA: TRAP transporter permease [Firmicutes bacterium]|nr:TRAP transporter permease [Candidatus Fermentithermobacillaceae bacterium]
MPQRVGQGALDREQTTILARFVSIVSVGLAIFHLYTGLFGASSAMLQRGVHWTVLSALIFLLYPVRGKDKAPSLADYVLAGLSAATGIYALATWKRVAAEAGVTNRTDLVFGIIAVLLVLEITRRVVGLPLMFVGAAFLAYGYFGAWLPGFFGHRYYSLQRIIGFLYSTTEGIYGVAMSVSATYVALFVIFGAFLEKFGAGDFFVEMSLALTGRFRGGPAKAAILSSALVGTISGSAVANVVTTGTFTIPMMKKIGYKPWVAGAVEALASTGGQIMPPVMGAAAFLMAEMINVPYGQVMKAAAIPALLYFWSAYVLVHLEAVKENIPILPASERPSLKKTVASKGYFLITIVLLTVAIIRGMTPTKAVTLAISSILVLDLMFNKDRKGFLRRVYQSLEEGTKGMITVAAACACAGIIVGVTAMSGLGLKFSQLMLSMSGQSKLLALILTMTASLILGCGLPTTAAYVVLATMAAPALVRLGVPLLAAHLFVFYFGCISTITPPVALSSYAAAAIAKTDPDKVGWTAFRFGLVSFIVPYMWVYGPGLLMQGSLVTVLRTLVTSVLGVSLFAIGIAGYGLLECSVTEKLLTVLAGLMLIDPGSVTDLVGLVCLAVFLVIHLARYRRGKRG